MSLADRQKVPGTEAPVIHLLHRVYNGKKNGAARASKQWMAEYCIDARRRQVKLGTTNKTTAIKLAHDLHRKLQNNELFAPKIKIALAELVKQYMEYQNNKGRAPKTIEKYTFVLNSLVQWAADLHRESASSITVQDFWSFNKWMSDKGLSQKTRYDRLVIVKQLFKWACGKVKLLAQNPFVGESIAEPESQMQPCFTPEQVKILLAKADPHEAAIYTVMAYAGLRFGEVQQLHWADVDRPQKGYINIRLGGSNGTTKGKRSRQIPIHAELRKTFDSLPKDFDTVFTARPSGKFPDGGGLISERRLLTSLKRLCKKCKFQNPRQYKLHTFRHAFASMLARSNVSYKYALEFMGHRDSRILDLYYKMFDSVAHEAIGTINYLGDTPKVPAA